MAKRGEQSFGGSRGFVLGFPGNASELAAHLRAVAALAVARAPPNASHPAAEEDDWAPQLVVPTPEAVEKEVFAVATDYHARLNDKGAGLLQTLAVVAAIEGLFLIARIDQNEPIVWSLLAMGIFAASIMLLWPNLLLYMPARLAEPKTALSVLMAWNDGLIQKAKWRTFRHTAAVWLLGGGLLVSIVDGGAFFLQFERQSAKPAVSEAVPERESAPKEPPAAAPSPVIAAQEEPSLSAETSGITGPDPAISSETRPTGASDTADTVPASGVRSPAAAPTEDSATPSVEHDPSLQQDWPPPAIDLVTPAHPSPEEPLEDR
jgi:hypothetical protein